MSARAELSAARGLAVDALELDGELELEGGLGDLKEGRREAEREHADPLAVEVDADGPLRVRLVAAHQRRRPQREEIDRALGLLHPGGEAAEHLPERRDVRGARRRRAHGAASFSSMRARIRCEKSVGGGTGTSLVRTTLEPSAE